MAIDQARVIDAIGVDGQTGSLILTISDHLPWTSGEGLHFERLRDKLNAYMAFVESGGLIETYPDAAGRAVVINVVGKYDLSGSASDFYDNAAATIAAAGLSLHFEKFVDPEGLE